MQKLCGRLLIASLCVFLCACKPKKAETLVVLMSPENPPFSYKIDKDLSGFDVEIAKIIAKKLGLKLVIKKKSFSLLIDSLLDRQGDVIISTLAITEERGRMIDFSFPYAVGSQIVLVPKGNPSKIRRLKDLKQIKVGVERLSVSEKSAEEHVEDVNIFKYETLRMALDPLDKGELEAIILDESLGRYIVKVNNKFELVALTFPKNLYAVGILKGNISILKKINKAISELRNTEEEKILHKKYLGEDYADGIYLNGLPPNIVDPIFKK